MLMLNTRPAAKGRRNMKARLEPLSRSICGERRPRSEVAAAPHGQGGACVFVPVCVCVFVPVCVCFCLCVRLCMCVRCVCV